MAWPTPPPPPPGEPPWRPGRECLSELETYLEKRNALFRNPTLKAARLLMDEPVGGWESPDLPLAATHKARLQWLGATDEMLAESVRWLQARNYETTCRGAPPLTPEKRDADRKALGMPPL